MNTTLQLLGLGQSVWYDNIQRSLLKNGELAGMMERGEIRGVTSNLSPEEIFFHLAIEDIKDAADLFLPLYQQTSGGDGYVSLEVSPSDSG